MLYPSMKFIEEQSSAINNKLGKRVASKRALDILHIYNIT